MSLITVIQTLRTLSVDNVPGGLLDSEGWETGDSHWGGTLDEMKKYLKRDLTDEEVTALSVTRSFGPMPSLDANEILLAQAELFPKGNNRGTSWEWWAAAEKLAAITANTWVTRLLKLDTVGRECCYIMEHIGSDFTKSELSDEAAHAALIEVGVKDPQWFLNKRFVLVDGPAPINAIYRHDGVWWSYQIQDREPLPQK